jgi:hypothetical protein
MPRALLSIPALVPFFVALALVTACGGSSSETPPPVEPDPTTLGLGPAGETKAEAPPTLIEERPDAGRPRPKSP